MKNTDLMVGNYLQRIDGSIVSVKRLIKDDDDILVNETQGLFTLGYTALPIPLTEEILLKCGFEKCEKHDNFYQIVLNDWTKIYVAFHDNQYAVELSVSKHSFCPNVKYLHQLQNLYHSLTGQELKIEL